MGSSHVGFREPTIASRRGDRAQCLCGRWCPASQVGSFAPLCSACPCLLKAQRSPCCQQPFPALSATVFCREPPYPGLAASGWERWVSAWSCIWSLLAAHVTPSIARAPACPSHPSSSPDPSLSFSWKSLLTSILSEDLTSCFWEQQDLTKRGQGFLRLFLKTSFSWVATLWLILI